MTLASHTQAVYTSDAIMASPLGFSDSKVKEMKFLRLSLDALFVVDFVAATASEMLITLSLIVAKQAPITRAGG